MYPIVWKIGDFTIYSYGVMAAVGFLLASWLVSLNRKHAQLSENQATAIVFIGVIAGLAGARIFYVIQFYDEFFRNAPWTKMLKINEGGLVFFGGFLLAFAAIIGYCRWKKLPLVAVLDVVAPALAVAHACGRIGCFLNGCCYGKLSGVFCAVTYPENSEAFRKFGPHAVHPVQLYEAGFNLVLAALLFWTVRRGKTGVAMSGYIIAYGIWRFLVEYWRGDNPLYGWFTAAQWIGLAMIPAGVILLVCFLRRPGRNDAQQEQAG